MAQSPPGQGPWVSEGPACCVAVIRMALLVMPQGNDPARDGQGSLGSPHQPPGVALATCTPSCFWCHHALLHPGGSGGSQGVIREGWCMGAGRSHGDEPWPPPAALSVVSPWCFSPGPAAGGVSQVPSPNCSQFPARRRPRRAAAPTTASAAPRVPPAPPAAWPDSPRPPRARPAPGRRTWGPTPAPLSCFFAPNLRPSPEGASVTHSVNALAPQGQPTPGRGDPTTSPGVPRRWVHREGGESSYCQSPP